MLSGGLISAWFAVASLYLMSTRLWLGENFLGLDARIYYRAAQAWLAGGDPWAVGVDVGGRVFHFAGLPPTLIVTAPFTLLPEDVAVATWMGLCLVASVWTVRRFGYPLTFLAFPPIVHAVITGNPQGWLVPLVILVPAVAPLVKVYAALPILGEARWRAAAGAVALGLATILVAPALWLDYLEGALGIGNRLVNEATGGWGTPVLVLGVAVILLVAVRDRRAAGWLAPLIAWPASQFHYATFAMPLGSPLLLALLAVPIKGWPVVAVALWMIWTLLPDRDRAAVRPLGRREQDLVAPVGEVRNSRAVAGRSPRDAGPRDNLGEGAQRVAR